MNTLDVREAIQRLTDIWLPDGDTALLDRFAWLVACGRIFLPEYRFKWPQMAWWDNAAFTEYLRHFEEEEGMNADRRWNHGQLMRLIESVPGDTAECGSYKGAGSYLMCRWNALHSERQRMHHIFDSFEGLSEPLSIDGTHWKKNSLAGSEKEVHAALAPFVGSYALHKGWIPDRFADVENTVFAFVHIDVDLYQPTKDSLEFFYPRLASGGVLVCDDYGFTSCPGATMAVDAFLADKPEKMLSLASGGGWFLKGIQVSTEKEL